MSEVGDEPVGVLKRALTVYDRDYYLKYNEQHSRPKAVRGYSGGNPP